MNSNELINNPKDLNNAADLYKDLAAGDPYALKMFEGLDLDLNAIKTALNFIVQRDGLTEQEKANLIKDSWRINFRDKPPTPEEFLTEKYLGPTAKTIYPRIRDVFLQFMDPTQRARNLVLYPHIGWGKLLLNTCIIYTYEGPKLVKDIKVGDVICTPNGKTANVINKQNYPDAPIYKVTFSDGRTSYTGGPHFWKAAHNHNTRKWNPEKKVYDKCKPEPCWKIITTEKILEDIKEYPNHRWFIPLTNPVTHNKRDHIIDPYTLGVLLGDGYFGEKQVTLVGDDLEIFQEAVSLKGELKTPMKKQKYTTNYRKSSKEILPEISRLGLARCVSYSKFIPDEYLYDSIENRIALLQGLMDTDGTVEDVGPKAKASNRRAHPSFWTTSEKLKDNILTLIYGLGGIARWSKRSKEGSGVKNKDAYVIYFNFPENNFPIFRLERKQKYLDEEYKREKKYKEKRKPQVLHIKSIEKTDLKGGACIETDDAEHLFLTDDYIVTHNSFLSTMIMLYITVNVSLMRDPYKYFGLSPATLLAQVLISYSIKKSRELLLAPYLNIMSASPYFEKVNRKDTMKELRAEYDKRPTVDKLYYTTADPDSELMLDSGVAIKVASSVQALLGLSAICSVLSELSYFRDAGKSDDYILRIYNDTKGRIYSRMKGNYYGVSILDSSPNSLTSPLESWIWYEASKDPNYYVVKGSVWQWNPKEYEQDFKNHDTFKIFTGGKGQPPRILDPLDPMLQDPTADKSKIIEVPSKGPDGKLRSYFEDDLIKSLKDFGGIPAGAADSLITDYNIIEDMFDNNLRNIYLNISAPASASPKELIWSQIRDTFFINKAGRYEYYYLPYLSRCISVDQSEVTDVTSISMAHVERDRDSDELIYVVDFTIAIVPSKERVNLAAIEEFIRDLRSKGNINITKVSFDRFQSAVTVQNLKRDKFEVENLSVDRTTGPYLNLISLMNRRKIVVGKNIFLKNNLKSLYIVHRAKSEGVKIDHDSSAAQVLAGDSNWDSSYIGYYGKDVSDSVAAVVELCSKEYPVAQVNWDPKSVQAMPANLKESNRQRSTEQLRKFMALNGFRL